MSEIIEVVIDDQTIYFESGEEDEGFEKISAKGVGEKISGSFQAVLNTVKLVATSTVRQVKEFDKAIAPDEFQFQFGVRLSGELGAVVTKTGGEAQISVTLTYKHDKDKKDKE
jgi:hypothetical protein